MWMLITSDSEFVKNPWRSPTGVLGHLKPGVTRAAAEAELDGIERGILSEAPTDVNVPQEVPVVLDLQSEVTWLSGRNLRTALLVLFAAVFVVLLIACVNVANLLLAQAADRQKEFAVRASLGAPRGRLIRQLLVESALLSIGGALLGVLLAFAAVQVFRAKNPIQLPPGNPIQVNAEVLAFTVVLALASVVLFGLLPAWRASRLNLSEAIKESSRNLTQSGTARRTGFVLVATEVGLSLVLLAGAGLLLQSLARLAATPLGYRTDHLLTASVRLPKGKYGDVDHKAQFFRQLTEQIGALLSVSGVTVGSRFNLSGSSFLSVEGRPFSRENAPLDTASETIDDDFLQVLGIPLLRGREFDGRDRSTTEPVAVINQALADKYFPNGDPLGQHVKLAPPDSKDPWLTIVGVVGNVKTNTVFQEMAYVVPPGVYQPLSQQPEASMSILIRTRDDPNSLATPLAQTLLSIDNDVTLADVKTMDERLAERESQPRFRTILLSAFALLALILATLGIYGVLTQSVVRRTGEIGVRMALGASRQKVMQMIVRQAFGAVAIGIVAGTIATLFLARLAKGLLYDVNPDNPFTLVAVAVLLIVVAGLASYLPARRATTIDPLNALRSQ
jgi:putative ABC transport system permease protein